MGRKCFIKGCKSNYNKSNAEKNDGLRERNDELLKDFQKVPMFGLPCKKKRYDERQRLIKSIPHLTEQMADEMIQTPTICRKQWPDNATFKTGS